MRNSLGSLAILALLGEKPISAPGCAGSGIQGRKLHERFMVEPELIHVQLDASPSNEKENSRAVARYRGDTGNGCQQWWRGWRISGGR